MMQQQRKKSRGAGAVAAALVIGVLLWGGSASAAEDKPKIPEKPWIPGPGGKGKVFPSKGKGGKGGGGLPSNLPAGFDFGGNGLYIDPNCEFVIEGNLFWQGDSFGRTTMEAETLAATLALDPKNSVIGYVDYLIDTLGYRQPEQIAWKILEEASPMCASVEPSLWGLGLLNWYNDFLERLIPYVEEATALAPDDFDPEAEEELDDGPPLDAWEDEEDEG